MTAVSAVSQMADVTDQPVHTPKSGVGNLKVGLIDSHRLSGEYLVNAIEKCDPYIKILSYDSISHFIAECNIGLDLVIYYLHSSNTLEEVIARDVRTMQQSFPDLPVVVLSDVEETYQQTTIHNALSSGARGFIPTRTTGIPVAIAAIHFVNAGGTFAPIDQLLNSQATRSPTISCPEPQVSLTAQQLAVLSHLREGKANKLIAHELDISESTVKVHIRNIMRKVGATNRTQAAYKVQQLSNSLMVQQSS